MEPAPSPANPGASSRRIRAVLLESLAVGAVGFVLALAANQLSPRGLALTRDYFPRVTVPPVVTSGTNSAPVKPADALAARIRQRGLQIAGSNEVAQFFQDPRHAQGLIVFVDARDDAHYRAGHVPGAVQFDHYRPEVYLPQALPLVMSAEKIVVYCTGGDCEDSEFAAEALSSVGVSKERLFIYLGGFSEWSTNGLPVERGERHSGQIHRTSP